jgi:hypothetical protein
VVARYVDERNIEAADDVLQVVERQVATGNHQVGAKAGKLVGVKRLIDLVRNREDPRHVRHT